MRLIDADDFEKFLRISERAGADQHGIEDIIKLVIKQPTAYNVDKVVEQLEIEGDTADDNILVAGDYSLSQYWDGVSEGMKKATEIVKGGGRS